MQYNSTVRIKFLNFQFVKRFHDEFKAVVVLDEISNHNDTHYMNYLNII